MIFPRVLKYFFLLTFVHILIVAFSIPANKIDYTVLIYIFYIDRQVEYELFPSAFLFGLFSDYVMGAFFGTGVILFIIFGIYRQWLIGKFSDERTRTKVGIYITIVVVYSLYYALILTDKNAFIGQAVGHILYSVFILLPVLFYMRYKSAPKKA